VQCHMLFVFRIGPGESIQVSHNEAPLPCWTYLPGI
jgi:hypothetical protein